MEITLVAAYFGGWKTPPEPAVAWYQPSPWGINADNSLYMGNYPERFPLYGAVDEDNQSVIDDQLSLAESAGINVFAVNWYRDEYLSYAAARIAASTVAPSVKWCIQWSNHYASMHATYGTKTWLFEGIRLAALRMGGARYWKKDGKPVLIIFSHVHLDDCIRAALAQPVGYTPSLIERDSLVKDIRHIVGNVISGVVSGGITGTTVSVAANAPYLVLMTDDAEWHRVTGIDATTDYNARMGSFSGTYRLTRSYPEMRQAAFQNWTYAGSVALTRNKARWATVMAGFDAKPWGGTASDALHDNCSPTIEEFKAHLADAKYFATRNGMDGTVFLYAWNEFGEGGWVQPTPAIGTSRIDAMASVF